MFITSNIRFAFVVFAVLLPFVAPLFRHGFTGHNFKISHNQTGFHRILCYDADIQDTVHGSKILIKEILPKDIYVDPYQVIHRNEVSLKDFVDSEVPAYRAQELPIQLCSLSMNSIHQICIPIHFRYQFPHNCELNGKTVTVNMNIPSVFLQIKRNNDSFEVFDECFSNEVMASWIYLQDLKVHSHFEIPVGCTEHFYLVLFLLTLTVGFSTIYISVNLQA